MAIKARKGRRYWVYQSHYECPVCGRGGVNRERRYTRKPKNPSKRYEFDQRYCGCMRM